MASATSTRCRRDRWNGDAPVTDAKPDCRDDRLGKSGLLVPAVALGGASLGSKSTEQGALEALE